MENQRIWSIFQGDGKVAPGGGKVDQVYGTLILHHRSHEKLCMLAKWPLFAYYLCLKPTYFIQKTTKFSTFGGIIIFNKTGLECFKTALRLFNINPYTAA